MDMLGSFIISENTSDSLHCQCFGMEIQVGICVKSKILQQWTFHIVAIHRLSYFMRKVSQYLETLGWTHTTVILILTSYGLAKLTVTLILISFGGC